jgi:hypothetical protein
MPRQITHRETQERIPLASTTAGTTGGCLEQACLARRWRLCGRPGCTGAPPLPFRKIPPGPQHRLLYAVKPMTDAWKPAKGY